MRRLALFPTVFVLLLASLMAPYQHVHLRLSRPYPYAPQEDDDDDDSAIVHIHFYAVPLPPSAPSDLASPGGNHVAQALDTFHAVLHAGLLALAAPISRALLSDPEKSKEEFAEVVEACGHDPPVLDVSIPRAPPA